MSSVSETALNTSGDKIETALQEQKTELHAGLVELGKVSDTSGGWLGTKADTGLGLTVY